MEVVSAEPFEVKCFCAFQMHMFKCGSVPEAQEKSHLKMLQLTSADLELKRQDSAIFWSWVILAPTGHEVTHEAHLSTFPPRVWTSLSLIGSFMFEAQEDNPNLVEGYIDCGATIKPKVRRSKKRHCAPVVH